VNRTVAALTKKGITNLKSDSENYRKRIVELTPLGKDLAKQGSVILEKYDSVLSSNLTVKDRQLFSELLGKMNIQG
jgi:DNA-binding MarR family transcriptional regulator